MNPHAYGLHGVPAGDPGFTISVEIDSPLWCLIDDDCARLLDAIDEDNARLDESPLGHARLVVDLPHTGWFESGQRAVHAATRVADRFADQFVVVGVETCRTDVWLAQPFFAPEPDGLGELPEWCSSADPTRSCTVAIAVEGHDSRQGRPNNAQLLRNFTHTGGARLARSPRGRRHIIVEHRLPTVDHAAELSAKSLQVVSNSWSITRVRSTLAHIYREEVAAPAHAVQVLPRWQYASDDESTRLVVVPDWQRDHAGWSIDFVGQDGRRNSSQLVRSKVWQDDAGIVNLKGVGKRVAAWTAEIAGGAHLDGFTTARGGALPVDSWDASSAWLVESLIGQGSGLIIELGPSDYDPESEDEVINAQLHVLDDGVVMVRRSREVLERLRLAHHCSDKLELDLWHHDNRWDDCTDGYLFSRDLLLVANVCTTWFRDHGRVDSLEKLGCSYGFVDELPRS
ncbi:MAG: hypothetical protein WBF79_13995 [Rhodococcus sp. (in: high G+C Gram-positive bacteria)]